MKVLIISDEENLVNQTKIFFQNNGLDTICYKWLLKALDNIEEIQPDVIVLSSSEYPRHWKTLVQFVKSGIGGNEVQVYLYEPTPLALEDEEKAKALGITGCFFNLENHTLNDVFGKIIDFNKTENTRAYADNDDSDNCHEVPTVDAIVNEKKSGHILLTNPKNNSFVSGKVVEFNNHRMEVVMDYSLEGISNNDSIDYVTFFDETQCFTFSAEIFILNDVSNTVILTIQGTYEEI